MTGCVERLVRIDTVPSGGELFWNGERIGTAPLEHPFVHYGTVRIDASLPNRPAVTRWVELAPPWYQRPPMEFFAELLDPRTHVDRHVVAIELPEAAPQEDTALRARADELRQATK